MIFLLTMVIWVLLMILYALITSELNSGRHRCNVKRQVIEFKRVKSKVNDSIRGGKRR